MRFRACRVRRRGRQLRRRPVRQTRWRSRRTRAARSSAWPILIPGTSVMRLRTISVIPGALTGASPNSITTGLKRRPQSFFKSRQWLWIPAQRCDAGNDKRSHPRGRGAGALARREAAGHECVHAECHHRRRACRRHVELPFAVRAAAGAALSGLSHRHLARAVRRSGARAAGPARNARRGAALRARLLHRVRRARRQRKRDRFSGARLFGHARHCRRHRHHRHGPALPWAHADQNVDA